MVISFAVTRGAGAHELALTRAVFLVKCFDHFMVVSNATHVAPLRQHSAISTRKLPCALRTMSGESLASVSASNDYNICI